jgi:hypothetical protein
MGVAGAASFVGRAHSKGSLPLRRPLTHVMVRGGTKTTLQRETTARPRIGVGLLFVLVSDSSSIVPSLPPTKLLT